MDDILARLLPNQRLEIESILESNLRLRQVVKDLKQREVDGGEDTAQKVLTTILQELLTHYRQHVAQTGDALHEYHAVDTAGRWHPLPQKCTNEMEDLLHGRRKSFRMPFRQHDCEVSLHPALLDDGLPLVVMHSPGEIFAIKRRTLHTTHLQLFKFQPIVNGMECSNTTAQHTARRIKPETSVHLNHPLLAELASVWLRCDPGTADALQANVLVVNGADLDNFLNMVKTQPKSVCYFLLSGQDRLFAYLQVNDEKSDVPFVLPIGSLNVQNSCIDDVNNFQSRGSLHTGS